MAEKHIWCKGDCEDENAIYYDDGNDHVYIDEEGNEYICTKHHWQCPNCNKIVQVG